MDGFDETVGREIRLVIPADYFVQPGGRLPVAPGINCFIFRASLLNEWSERIQVIALSEAFTLTAELENHLTTLRDELGSREELLVVISVQETFMEGNDLTDFIDGSLKADSPYFLSLCLYRDQAFKTTVDGEIFEDLHRVIRDVWTGWIGFNGPTTGLQQVNIELMRDACWKCHRPMQTVTGLVFPDRQLDSWDNDSWLYFNQLIPLSALADKYALAVQAFAGNRRKRDPMVTPVAYRYSRTTGPSYWAAGCPHCNALRGDFYVHEARTAYLFELTSRSNGDLEYASILLDADRELIALLGAGSEACPHTCIMGWSRLLNE